MSPIRPQLISAFDKASREWSLWSNLSATSPITLKHVESFYLHVTGFPVTVTVTVVLPTLVIVVLPVLPLSPFVWVIVVVTFDVTVGVVLVGVVIGLVDVVNVVVLAVVVGGLFVFPISEVEVSVEVMLEDVMVVKV